MDVHVESVKGLSLISLLNFLHRSFQQAK